ncbi:MAG: hypothetical protein WDW38_002451 [Sanguina aurantia]
MSASVAVNSPSLQQHMENPGSTSAGKLAEEMVAAAAAAAVELGRARQLAAIRASISAAVAAAAAAGCGSPPSPTHAVKRPAEHIRAQPVTDTPVMSGCQRSDGILSATGQDPSGPTALLAPDEPPTALTPVTDTASLLAAIALAATLHHSTARAQSPKEHKRLRGEPLGPLQQHLCHLAALPPDLFAHLPTPQLLTLLQLVNACTAGTEAQAVRRTAPHLWPLQGRLLQLLGARPQHPGPALHGATTAAAGLDAVGDASTPASTPAPVVPRAGATAGQAQGGCPDGAQAAAAAAAPRPARQAAEPGLVNLTAGRYTITGSSTPVWLSSSPGGGGGGSAGKASAAAALASPRAPAAAARTYTPPPLDQQPLTIARSSLVTAQPQPVTAQPEPPATAGPKPAAAPASSVTQPTGRRSAGLCSSVPPSGPPSDPSPPPCPPPSAHAPSPTQTAHRSLRIHPPLTPHADPAPAFDAALLSNPPAPFPPRPQLTPPFTPSQPATPRTQQHLPSSSAAAPPSAASSAPMSFLARGILPPSQGPADPAGLFKVVALPPSAQYAASFMALLASHKATSSSSGSNSLLSGRVAVPPSHTPYPVAAPPFFPTTTTTTAKPASAHPPSALGGVPTATMTQRMQTLAKQLIQAPAAQRTHTPAGQPIQTIPCTATRLQRSASGISQVQTATGPVFRPLNLSPALLASFTAPAALSSTIPLVYVHHPISAAPCYASAPRPPLTSAAPRPATAPLAQPRLAVAPSAQQKPLPVTQEPPAQAPAKPLPAPKPPTPHAPITSPSSTPSRPATAPAPPLTASVLSAAAAAAAAPTAVMPAPVSRSAFSGQPPLAPQPPPPTPKPPSAPTAPAPLRAVSPGQPPIPPRPPIAPTKPPIPTITTPSATYVPQPIIRPSSHMVTQHALSPQLQPRPSLHSSSGTPNPAPATLPFPKPPQSTATPRLSAAEVVRQLSEVAHMLIPSSAIIPTIMVPKPLLPSDFPLHAALLARTGLHTPLLSRPMGLPLTHGAVTQPLTRPMGPILSQGATAAAAAAVAAATAARLSAGGAAATAAAAAVPRPGGAITAAALRVGNFATAGTSSCKSSGTLLLQQLAKGVAELAAKLAVTPPAYMTPLAAAYSMLPPRPVSGVPNLLRAPFPSSPLPGAILAMRPQLNHFTSPSTAGVTSTIPTIVNRTGPATAAAPSFLSSLRPQSCGAAVTTPTPVLRTSGTAGAAAAAAALLLTSSVKRLGSSSSCPESQLTVARTRTQRFPPSFSSPPAQAHAHAPGTNAHQLPVPPFTGAVPASSGAARLTHTFTTTMPPPPPRAQLLPTPASTAILSLLSAPNTIQRPSTAPSSMPAPHTAHTTTTQAPKLAPSTAHSTTPAPVAAHNRARGALAALPKCLVAIGLSVVQSLHRSNVAQEMISKAMSRRRDPWPEAPAPPAAVIPLPLPLLPAPPPPPSPAQAASVSVGDIAAALVISGLQSRARPTASPTTNNLHAVAAAPVACPQTVKRKRSLLSAVNRNQQNPWVQPQQPPSRGQPQQQECQGQPRQQQRANPPVVGIPDSSTSEAPPTATLKRTRESPTQPPPGCGFHGTAPKRSRPTPPPAADMLHPGVSSRDGAPPPLHPSNTLSQGRKRDGGGGSIISSSSDPSPAAWPGSRGTPRGRQQQQQQESCQQRVAAQAALSQRPVGAPVAQRQPGVGGAASKAHVQQSKVMFSLNQAGAKGDQQAAKRPRTDTAAAGRAAAAEAVRGVAAAAAAAAAAASGSDNGSGVLLVKSRGARGEGRAMCDRRGQGV